MIKRWKEYSYILCLCISAVIIAYLHYADLLPESLQKGGGQDEFLEKDITLMEFRSREEISEVLEKLKVSLLKTLPQKLLEDEGVENEQSVEVNPQEEVVKEELVLEEVPESEKPGVTFKGDGNLVETVAGNEVLDREETEKGTVVFTSDNSYFNDALFIGDSRTEGLREYGDLGQATVLADSGMSIYRLWKENFRIDNQKLTLEQILAEKKFGKVYLMLGINELGYDSGQTIKKYRETLMRIEEAQPEAIIFLQANLHVTDEKAKNSDIYNNSNIDRMNQMLAELAEEKGYFYLDVNPVFDDENGNLSKEYTVDQAHILGIYYEDWVNWILKHCVKSK